MATLIKKDISFNPFEEDIKLLGEKIKEDNDNIKNLIKELMFFYKTGHAHSTELEKIIKEYSDDKTKNPNNIKGKGYVFYLIQELSKYLKFAKNIKKTTEEEDLINPESNLWKNFEKNFDFFKGIKRLMNCELIKSHNKTVSTTKKDVSGKTAHVLNHHAGHGH